MSNTFVFIIEGQQGGYSKNTLSSINAQVARFGHQKRRQLAKSKSATVSSPRFNPSTSLSAVTCQSYHAQHCQNDGFDGRFRRASAPALVELASDATQLHECCESEYSNWQYGAHNCHPITTYQRRCSIDRCSNDSLKQEPYSDGSEPESVDGLFDQIYPITKPPSYHPYPCSLNSDEQRLMQCWFTALGDTFGMAFEPDSFQGPLIKYNIAFQVPLRWAMIKAANRLNLDNPQNATLIYTCKRKALRHLNSILCDPTVSTDEAVGSILQTVIHQTEYRKLHLRGMDAMIHARGGLAAVVQSSEVTCSDHILLMYTFARYEIPQLSELEALKHAFFLALSRMQSQSTAFLHTTAHIDNWAATINLNAHDDDSSHLAQWHYSAVRQRLFSPATSIGSLIRRAYPTAPCTEADFQVKARPFAALFQLAAILMLGFKLPHHRELFLQRLEQAAAKISTVCDVTGRPKIMAGTFIFMAGHVCRQVQSELGFGDRDRDRIGLDVALDGIAALKIFGLLSEETRLRLYTCLQGWLLGPEICSPYAGFVTGMYASTGSGLELDGLTQEDLKEMGRDITRLWVQGMRRNSAPVVL